MSDKMVMVTWVDSVRNSAWDTRQAHEAINPSECVSVGFLLSEDDDKIIIYNSDDPALNSLGMSLTIPRIAVRSITELRKK